MEEVLRQAEAIQDLCGSMGVDVAAIGAMAMIPYGYVRTTSDLDLAVAVPLEKLQEIADRLTQLRFNEGQVESV